MALDKKISEEGKKPQCFLFTWDASQPDICENLIKHNRLPHLKKLSQQGIRFEYSITNFPSKTAAGHSALFTGCYGDINGIVANSVEKGRNEQNTLLDISSGFDSKNLLAETFWSATARQGKKTLVLDAPMCIPAETFLKGEGKENLYIFSGFDGKKSNFEILTEKETATDNTTWKSLPSHEGAVKRFQIKAGDTPIYGIIMDNELDGVLKYNQILLSTTPTGQGTDAITLQTETTDYNSLLIHYGKEPAGVYFMLLSINEDGSSYKILKSATYIEKFNGQPLSDEHVRLAGGFQGNGPEHLYYQDKLGTPFYKGGDGTAEKIYLKSVDIIIHSYAKRLEYCVNKYQPDVVVSYLPYPDECLHIWYGFIDPNSNRNNTKYREKAYEIIAKAYSLCDDYLGKVTAMSDENTYIALAGDHGMAGFDKIFYPNTVLKEAGLLFTDSEGKIDLSRTKIIYGYEEGTFFKINSNKYKGGIVLAHEEEDIINKTVLALSNVRDPQTGMAVVTGFYYPNKDNNLGIGGARGGQLYIDLLPGYYFSSKIKDKAVENQDFPRGGHIFMPARKDMHTIFYMKGPSVKPGITGKAIHIIDIVPTLSVLLGISPPKNSVGENTIRENTP